MQGGVSGGQGGGGSGAARALGTVKACRSAAVVHPTTSTANERDFAADNPKSSLEPRCVFYCQEDVDINLNFFYNIMIHWYLLVLWGKEPVCNMQRVCGPIEWFGASEYEFFSRCLSLVIGTVWSLSSERWACVLLLMLSRVRFSFTQLTVTQGPQET